VTGAGHGIGRELALQLSLEGVKVVCWDINEASVKETCKLIEEQNGTAWAFKCDVSNRQEVIAVSQKTREAVGGGLEVSMLFNNAGIMPCKAFMKHSPEDLERLWGVNVKSHFWTLNEFLPDFIRQQRGHIVCLSSTAGRVGTPFLTAYCSTKYAVRGLMDALYLEMNQVYPNNPIKMTVVHPFVINTGLAEKPRTRFSALVPILEPAQAASIIIKGVKQNHYEVFVPTNLFYLFAISNLFPLKVKLALFDFLGCGVDPHD